MVKLRERNDETPVCPHCSTSLEEVWCRELSSSLGRRYIYFCATCRKVLGVSHRKGFWMG
jgi:uncharacterized protein with PIN domain